MHTLTTLHKAMNAYCRRLELAPAVLSSGAVESDIAFIGEAPATDEYMRKRPFVGWSGKRLWALMQATLHRNGKRLHRDDIYVTNTVKRRIAKQAGSSDVLGSEELEQWAVVLQWELAQLPNLRYVLLIGETPLHALYDRDCKINKWRGSVWVDTTLVRGRSVTVQVVNHPAAAVHDNSILFIMQQHMRRFNDIINGKWQPYRLKYNINPSYKQAVSWLRHLKREARTEGALALDLEGGFGALRCIGLATDEHEGFCINFRDTEQNRFTTAQESRILLQIQDLLSDRRTVKVIQNTAFELMYLWYWVRLRVHGPIFDTLLAHHVLYPTLPHNLGFLTTYYTNHPYYKDEREEFQEGGAAIDLNTFWKYNIKDTCIMLPIMDALQVELASDKRVEQALYHYILPNIQDIAEMNTHGCLIDWEERELAGRRLIEQEQKELEVFYRAVAQATGDGAYKPNPVSPKQMKQLYFERLRLVGRGTSTDATNRRRMFQHKNTNEQAKAVLRAVNQHAKTQKLLNTYFGISTAVNRIPGTAGKLDEDERMRTEYKQHGTKEAPGRLSSSATLWRTGGNLQNIPPVMRKFFVAEAGYELVYFDLAQAEARFVGWDAEIDNWMEQFERARLNPGSYDAHCALAADMYHIPYQNVPKSDFDANGKPTIRYFSKRARHALNYRMLYERLSTILGCPVDEARKLYAVYHRTTPELRSWWAAIYKYVVSHKRLYSAYGRRMIWLSGTIFDIDNAAFDSIIAFRPQSTIGDHVQIAVHRARTSKKWPLHARLWQNNHDSVTAICKLGLGMRVLKLLKQEAERPIKFETIKSAKKVKLCIPADCKRSVPDEKGVHRWSTLKSVEV